VRPSGSYAGANDVRPYFVLCCSARQRTAGHLPRGFRSPLPTPSPKRRAGEPVAAPNGSSATAAWSISSLPVQLEIISAGETVHFIGQESELLRVLKRRGAICVWHEVESAAS
jgi:hypothetical protein